MSIQDAIFQAVRDGVSEAVSDAVRSNSTAAARAMAARAKGRRLIRRTMALLFGGLLMLTSLGGFMQGDIGPATAMLVVGAAIASLFYFLRPR